MDPENVIVIPPAETPAPSTGEVLAAAESMVQQAAQLAHMPEVADSSTMHEIIVIVSESRDLLRDLIDMVKSLGMIASEIRSAQIVAEIVEEVEEVTEVIELPEPAAPATVVEVNAPSGEAVVEKETVVDDNPPIPEKRGNEKPARRWL